MTTINEIFRTFGPEYLERYAMIMPKSHPRSSIPSSAVAPKSAALPFINARNVANSIGSIAPAGIAIAPLVNIIKPDNGWRNR